MDLVDGEVRMMPVDEGVVKAHPQPFGPEGVHIFPDKIPAGGGVGALIVGVLGIKHAESLVMLGGHHRVLHAGGLGLPGPFPGVVEIGVKIAEIFLVFFLADLFVGLDPLVPGRHGIQAPVDEHTEAVVAEPGGVAGGAVDGITGHIISSRGVVWAAGAALFFLTAIISPAPAADKGINRKKHGIFGNLPPKESWTYAR